MKTKTLSIATAAIIALVALAVSPAVAEETVLSSGEVTLTAGSTNATQTIGLYNIKGQEWGEIIGFRILNGATNVANVKVTCEDLAVPVTIFEKDATGTNSPQHVAAGAVYSAAGSSSYAKTVKVSVFLYGCTNVTGTKTLPYLIYSK
jgi:hypothetical protein